MINRRQMLAVSAGTIATLGFSGAQGLAQAVPTVAEVLYDKEIPVLGNPHGNVTIVEYFDYQCPYCKKGHGELMRVVKDDGNVRLVLKDWIIFGDMSAYAARLVLAAEKSGNYVKAMEALMATPGRLTKEQVDAAMKKGGLDAAKLEAAYKADSKRINGILERNMNQGEAFNFSGTPSFVIGTKLYGGVMKQQELIAAIADARKS
ncbi:DsbA family protein [Ochrobactrum sp. RH2CCR150]|jgi:protein-disulfide isomerase|uniref:DsbA family protein n=1 Tax=Ochrobactrum sp. RH2CCR150 TaxID=2587044 RepID=UPI0015F9344E|nr:protein-disulfide isomerase [Ochrobactrum sp. RH2CCR150]URQ74377.1 MAG: DsbA family protein [Candidatus Ochrobactrum gambitense]WEK16820.1 MAG: DsbA family protein [Candidatus Ochrobactrum gambitense]